MTEKIPTPEPKTPAIAARAAKTGKQEQDQSSFADFLAEAEAIQDYVMISPKVAANAPRGMGVLPVAVQGIVALLTRPLPHAITGVGTGAGMVKPDQPKKASGGKASG